MLKAYRIDGRRLMPLDPGEDLTRAAWIDLYRPMEDQVAAVATLGIEVPTLADMEEIEISNRFYREGGTDYMTVVVPGRTPEGGQVSGPVAFILSANQLVTVRHHAPRPFETFPDRAERSSLGCADSLRLFLGLVEEIISRLADLLEGSGKELDLVAGAVFSGGDGQSAEALQSALQAIGRSGETLARIRLGLLSIERMLSIFGIWADDRPVGSALHPFIKALMRDIQALEVHADFLSGRVSLATDTTLGMVNLAQNRTVRIVSVVAALFLPPTLIASIYGMNFTRMPELAQSWGYPAALALMAGSAAVTWAYFKWRGWL
jgi:magnesium transporter